MGGFGNRHRASEVDIPDAPETWAQCPDYECTPCKSKRTEACPHGNFTGIGDIICVVDSIIASFDANMQKAVTTLGDLAGI